MSGSVYLDDRNLDSRGRPMIRIAGSFFELEQAEEVATDIRAILATDPKPVLTPEELRGV